MVELEEMSSKNIVFCVARSEHLDKFNPEITKIINYVRKLEY